jgi:hypothetical protein
MGWADKQAEVVSWWIGDLVVWWFGGLMVWWSLVVGWFGQLRKSLIRTEYTCSNCQLPAYLRYLGR